MPLTTLGPNSKSDHKISAAAIAGLREKKVHGDIALISEKTGIARQYIESFFKSAEDLDPTPTRLKIVQEANEIFETRRKQLQILTNADHKS